MQTALIGNSFPWSLVRREITAVPLSFAEFRQEIAEIQLVSFWGHPETLADVSKMCGCDLTPQQERLALSLSPEKLPELNGTAFRICYLVSPDYRVSFRPSLNPACPETPEIDGWSILKIIWK